MLGDMPGVDEKSVDITLEKNVLTINGYVEPVQPDNYSLAYAEYEAGDFQRSFTLSTACCGCICPKPARPKPARLPLKRDETYFVKRIAYNVFQRVYCLVRNTHYHIT